MGPDTAGNGKRAPELGSLVVNPLIRERKVSNMLAVDDDKSFPEQLQGHHSQGHNQGQESTVVNAILRGFRKISNISTQNKFHHEDHDGDEHLIVEYENPTGYINPAFNENLPHPKQEARHHESAKNTAIRVIRKISSSANIYTSPQYEPLENELHPNKHQHQGHDEITAHELDRKHERKIEAEVVTGIRERKISNLVTGHSKKVWEDGLGIGSGQHDHFKIETTHLDKIVPDEFYEMEIEVERRPKAKLRTRKCSQFLAAMAANFGALALGAVLAWSATALPSLRSSGDIPDVGESEEAWIGSLVALGALAACPFGAYAMVTFGRRRTMMLLTAPFVGGWALIAFANILPFIGHPVNTIYMGRLITGFCGGAFTVISPVYIAETAHEKIRGGLASGFDLMLSIGMLYIYIIGAYASWQTQAIACGIIPLAFHILAMFVPESPRFLVEQGKIDEAGNALSWLFGIKTEQLCSELGMLKRSVEESQAKPVNFDRVVLKMSVLKPILICVAIMFFYTMTAIDAVIFYAVDIFESTGSAMDPTVSTIILGSVQVLATLPAAFIVDKCGRRPLLMISKIFMCLSFIAMGFFYYMTEDDLDNKLHVQYGWIPITALNVFLIAYSIGIGPLSMILLGEVVPSHIKGLTSCTALMMRWVLAFGVTNFFKTLENHIGMDQTYWLFASICGTGAIFVYFCIPETKGRSLDDIQTGFIHPSKLKALSLAQNNNMNVNSHQKH